MAEGILIGAIVGAAYNDLYNVAKDAVSKMVWCKKHCRALAQDLDTHLPILCEICHHMEVPARQWEQRLLYFKEKLEEGRFLVESCIQISLWHPIRRIRYSRYILKLRQEIQQQLQNLAAFNTLLLQQVHGRQQDLLEQQNKLRQEAIDPLIATMNGNTTLLLDWVRQSNSAGTDEGQSSSGRGKRVYELQVDQFLVGIENPVAQVKLHLLSGEGKMVTMLGGMGGIGKTTLAKAICKDPQVQKFFGDRIHFFTVSQSPDMMGLLSTIWQEIVDESVPLFQNEEDAYRQLKDRLHVMSVPSKPRLLVLDDVWSKANLENLLFEVKHCRTLITSRQAPSLETPHSHTYMLRLLSEENAQSLFCCWAFGQESIPPRAEETLVKEVISECKRLPLALKVIGGSLFGSGADWFPIEWRNARDKLRQAEPLGDYHKDALQRRLQASIDALDPKLQECFLDLGAYPEDYRGSADTLLDIWVYIRGMEWEDAVLALAELGSRCLLDFHKRIRGDDGLTLEYGSASTLIFSQHDVMRDLALYLGKKDHSPSQRARLLMPQKGRNIPNNWQSQAPLTAQIVSIYTGDMTDQDWPSLAFPFVEALLLYFDGDAYHIPPFLQSMCKLKVMSIRCFKRMCSIAGSLGGGSSELQSIDMENVALITPDTTPKLEKLRVKVFKGAGRVVSMFKSQNLASLSVRDGQFKLPKNCQQLSSLQLLNLSGCSTLYKLPKQLGDLTNLVCLSLRNCHELRELPISFCKLQHLEVLEIRRCSKFEKFPQSLGQLRALKQLSLAFCEELRELPTTFGQLVALKKFCLRGSNGIQYLPANFGLLRSLENLALDNCSGLKQLPQNFGQLSNLKQLILNRCLKLRHLPESFVQLSCLKKLSLLACSELEMLPESFADQRLICLEDLSLDDCTALGHLPKNIGQLSCLRRLSLRCCTELQELPEIFGQLSCLEYLSLENCKKVKHLPVSLGQLRRLKQLHLKGASELEALPENFGELHCLEVLGLGGCEKLKQLPERFGQLSELRRWEMVQVGLESLPASVGVGLVGLESVECSESLMPMWKAVRGDMAPHPRIQTVNATRMPSRIRRPKLK